jgi:hypothetical protein
MVQQRAGGKRTRAGNPSAHERGSNTGRAYEDVCIEVGGVLRAELRKCDRSPSDGKGLGTAVAVVQYAVSHCLLCLSVSAPACGVLSGS